MFRYRKALAYFGLVLAIAAYNAWSTYSAPYDCSDGEGHGPDPGTRECKAAIEAAKRDRGAESEFAFGSVVLIGIAGFGLFRLASTANRRFGPL